MKRLRGLCLAWGLIGVLARALPAAEPAWLVGKELDKQLGLPAGVSWSGRELRVGLDRLSQDHRVAIWLDRRVDPQQVVDLTVRDAPLVSLLERVASERHLGVALVGGVVYFGPPTTAQKIRTLAALRGEELRQHPLPAVRNEAVRPAPTRWPELQEPRALLARIAEESGFAFTGLERVPHDLWPAGSWPPLELAERLTLLAAGFELTFQVDPGSRSLQLVPIPDSVTLDRSYPAGPKPAETLKKWQAELPQAQLALRDGRLHVRARLEDHERLAGTARRVAPKTVGLDQKRWSTEVKEQPLGALLASLARSIGLELRLDRQAVESAGVSLDRRVSFQVKDATLDQLLSATLKDSGLTYRRQEAVVEVVVEKR